MHNVKCFHTKDKIRISLGVKTSMIFFRNHKSTRNHFQRKHFCLEKAEKIQTSLLVFMNAGFNKFLQEVLYRLFQKKQIVSMWQVTWFINEGIHFAIQIVFSCLIFPVLCCPSKVNPLWYKAAVLVTLLVFYWVLQEKSCTKSYKCRAWVGISCCYR